MPRPRKVPAVLVEATVRGNAKLASLPSDTARLGFFYVVLGEAKLSTPVPGQFASRTQFREVAGRFARYLEDYVKAGVIEVAPRLCERCTATWSTMPPRPGVLVVHDWHQHQYDPRKIERQREYEERQRVSSAPVSDAVSDAKPDPHSDGVSDAVSDANPTGDSRGRARPHVAGTSRARRGHVAIARRTLNVERRTESLHEENLVNGGVTRVERADVAALLARGWPRVTKAQRRVLDEVLSRHDVSGPEFAAEAIRATPADDDPLRAVIDADARWQEVQRRRADAEEAEWARQKDEDRESATEAVAFFAGLSAEAGAR